METGRFSCFKEMRRMVQAVKRMPNDHSVAGTVKEVYSSNCLRWVGVKTELSDRIFYGNVGGTADLPSLNFSGTFLFKLNRKL